MALYLRLRKFEKDKGGSIHTIKEIRTRINETLYTADTVQDEIDEAILEQRRAALFLDQTESRYYKFSPELYSSIIIEGFICH